jgi:uncharacterized protein YndB with AHSA1/START domain
MPAPSTKSAEFLHLERTLPAPRSLVYQAFTDPSRMLQWFGPHGFVASGVQLDVRVGGTWRGGMRGPDGRELVASGVYREVVPDQRLVFTYAWENEGVRGHETVCRLELADEGSQTHMTFSQGPFETAANARDHQGGWSEAFEKLLQAVAS